MSVVGWPPHPITITVNNNSNNVPNIFLNCRGTCLRVRKFSCIWKLAKVSVVARGNNCYRELELCVKWDRQSAGVREMYSLA